MVTKHILKIFIPSLLHFMQCLWWIHWFVSHLIYLSLTKPTM